MAQTLQRLRRRREFLNVADNGRKFAAPGLVLQALDRTGDAAGQPNDESVRVGFTVTRKVGNAVIRNRVRRRLRAAAAEIVPTHARQGFDLVLIGRAGTRNRRYEDLTADLTEALRRVGASRNGDDK